MSTNLVEAISTLEAMAVAAAEAKAISTEARKVYAYGHKMVGQTTVSLPETLRDALNEFLASEATFGVDRAKGNALAEQLAKAIIGVDAGLPAPKGFAVEAVQSAINAWKANAGSVRSGSGGSSVDAPGRVTLDFVYPDGAESVSPVGKDGSYTTHAEQAAVRSNLLWEILKRAKALSGISEDEKRGYTWPDTERAAWRTFYNECVKANTEGSVHLTMPVGDGNVMLVTITYKP